MLLRRPLFTQGTTLLPGVMPTAFMGALVGAQPRRSEDAGDLTRHVVEDSASLTRCIVEGLEIVRVTTESTGDLDRHVTESAGEMDRNVQEAIGSMVVGDP